MKRQTPLLAFPFAVIAAFSCGGEKSAERARPVVGDSAGVPVVLNDTAAAGRWHADSAPFITIGGKGDSIRFGEIVGIAILNDKSILVADAASDNVRRFDSQGKPLGTVVQRGPGAGELQSVTGLYTSSWDTVYVRDADNSVMQVIAPDGRVVRRITDTDFRSAADKAASPAVPAAVGVLDDGSVVTREAPPDAGRGAQTGPYVRSEIYRRGTPGGAQLASYGALPAETGERYANGTAVFTQAVALAYGNSLFHALGDTLGYSVYASDGRLERIVRVRRPRIPTPPDMLPPDSSGADAIPQMRALPDVVGFAHDNYGFIWVASFTQSDGRLLPIWYLFDAEGTLKQTVSTRGDFAVLATRDDLIAAVMTDADNLQHVALHVLRRWAPAGN